MLTWRDVEDLRKVVNDQRKARSKEKLSIEQSIKYDDLEDYPRIMMQKEWPFAGGKKWKHSTSFQNAFRPMLWMGTYSPDGPAWPKV